MHLFLIYRLKQKMRMLHTAQSFITNKLLKSKLSCIFFFFFFFFTWQFSLNDTWYFVSAQVWNSQSISEILLKKLLTSGLYFLFSIEYKHVAHLWITLTYLSVKFYFSIVFQYCILYSPLFSIWVFSVAFQYDLSEDRIDYQLKQWKIEIFSMLKSNLTK